MTASWILMIRPTIWRVPALSAFLVLLLGAGAAFAYQSQTVANGGTISGTIRFSGPVSQPHQLEVSKDRDACAAKPIYDQSLVVGKDGGLANVVVTLPDLDKGEAIQPATVIFDQLGCEYVPHVVAFPVGSTIEVINSDGILHSIHTESTANPPLDMAQPGFKKKIRITIEKPEAIKVTCDAHNWMEGWWYATSNPYFAVTDAQGHYKIGNVPPGAYSIGVWQEKLGTQTRRLSVNPGAAVTADFTFAPPAK